MYINSRMQLDDRLNAYEYALTEFCHNEKAFERDRSYASACILDIFLQMIDFFCMSGNVEKAIQKIIGLVGNSDDTLLLDIQSCLVVSDRCIFWFCCIYLAIYRKLPELIIQQLELEKELTFGIEWPTNHLRTDIRERVLDLVKLAVDKVALDIVTNPLRKDEVALRSLHFLSVTHVKCVAALEGLQRSTDLLTTYLSLYPTCIQLILMSARLKENSTGGVVLEGFEELLSNLAKGISGNQCLWNQYVEHALAEKRVNLAESILARWSERFCEDTTLNERNFNGRKDIFWFLNLSLYRMTQKNLKEAQSAIDNALKLASPQDFKHIVREHVAFTFAIEVDFKRNKPFGVILNLLNVYLADSRSTTILELLSRKFYRCIKRPRARQLLSNMLGPVSRDFTLLNSVLEACYGTSLLPEKVDDPKEFVDFIEALMEITPANYKLALSVYKSTTTFCHPSVATNAIKFWACSLLINSIFQAVPVPPENIWVDAANAMRNSEILDISVRFHQQALSVYPFSIKLWQFYLDLCRNTEDLDVIIEAAKERGVELR